MSWLNQNISLYTCQADNIGRTATVRDVLLTEFAMPHDWYFRHGTEWVSGNSVDLETIIDLRTAEITQDEKIKMKATLQCWTPAGMLKTKKKGFVEVISRTNLMQLDFDAATCNQYDIGELMRAVFDLPFVCFVGRSCSGTGFYALVQIAEPDRLKDYAEHCFEVLDKYGVPADTSKGRNPQDLRYVSYDSCMQFKDNPVSLHIKHFKPKLAPVKQNTVTTPATDINGNRTLLNAIQAIQSAPIGNRFPTVQKWSYTLGGYNDDSLLESLKQTIVNSSQYQGVEDKYLACAMECFKDGQSKPFNN